MSVRTGIITPPGRVKGAGPRLLSVIAARHVGIYWQKRATTLITASSSKLPLRDRRDDPTSSVMIARLGAPVLG